MHTAAVFCPSRALAAWKRCKGKRRTGDKSFSSCHGGCWAGWAGVPRSDLNRGGWQGHESLAVPAGAERELRLELIDSRSDRIIPRLSLNAHDDVELSPRAPLSPRGMPMSPRSASADGLKPLERISPRFGPRVGGSFDPNKWLSGG